MNLEKMIRDLNQLEDTWKSQARSTDIVGMSREWISGVCYGINLARKTVAYHLDWKSLK